MKSKFKNLLSFLFLFVLLATTLFACKSTGVVPPTTIKTTTETTTKEVVRDTIFKVEKDSSYYKAYLECVNGKVALKLDTEPIEKPGKHLKPPKVNLQDNVLIVNCESEAYRLFAQWKDIYIKEHRQTTQNTPYPVQREFTWWQKTQIILGRVFLVLLVIFIIAVVIRKWQLAK